jgi:hypothetical protein
MAFAAVSWWRGNPAADEDDVKRVTDEWTAKDVVLVGFGQSDEDDARPPDETRGSEPSESSEPSSASTSEKSRRKTSGSQP